MNKLVVGNGDNEYSDAVTLNYPETDATDVVFDLEETFEKGLPFDDDRFEMVEAYNVLEHLSQESYVSVMKEIGRVTEKGGTVIVSGPHWLSLNTAAGDHFRSFSEVSMDVFSVDHEYPTPMPQRFSVEGVTYYMSDWLIVKILDFFIPEDILRRHVPNTVKEVEFKLKVVE